MNHIPTPKLDDSPQNCKKQKHIVLAPEACYSLMRGRQSTQT